MKLLSFTWNNLVKVGVYTSKGILDLPSAYMDIYDAVEAPNFLYDMKALISGGDPVLAMVKDLLDKALRSSDPAFFKDPNSITWLPPVTKPEKVLCVAVNYRAHGEESSAKPLDRPYFFPKFPNAIIGHNQSILKPRVSKQVDWEVELAIIIGRRGKYIDVNRAFDYIFGYLILNDVSMRDWQFPSKEPYGMDWIYGKSMDSSTPVGPYIVTRDEIQDPHNLRLMLRVNGNVEQDDNTGNLIFKIPELIHWASQGVTLKPGDYISTGTPSGVGFPKGKFLKNGDVVEAEIEKIGILRNTVIEE
ncbi:fumarylacetoacetate hydrolase family protein [Vulcanisaeta souniana]|uniref:2-hydroxyhepta-2,4-diene-1,7-dioate isomerase n=1 Tax=Vulcanisaeta souniana JCM 11219 TaxID=1293586 RepID=A0A830EAN3_9CREN|nr:fumarylacetoacetate hydrolase family protein [Vulcanisaeta souniana]BDR92910.1 2-hydroxyhepta-2,4-diene-1,7-dioate isomerase [Vulcanisaeta souniana JCM 11219]GGI85526.1 2-hydroxyhepta-2,4-diene-1,7-dioate isomerase [Vulcanisaeta souniana JCM 11219]